METAGEMGHEAAFINPLKCSLVIDGDNSFRILHKEADVGEVDVVLSRVGASITDYGLAVVRHFEMSNTPVINSSTAISMSRDKFRALQILGRNGIRVPDTILTRSVSMGLKAIEMFGGTPVVLKTIQGTQGIGVMLADSAETVESIVETFWEHGKDIQIQKFIRESRGRDIRAFVIGDEVIAAMQRESTTGEFRANIHRGAEGKKIELTREQEEIALKSARVLGLKIAGIDLLMSRRGPVVVEANSSPGFEGLEAATGADIASRIIEFLVEYARS